MGLLSRLPIGTPKDPRTRLAQLALQTPRLTPSCDSDSVRGSFPAHKSRTSVRRCRAGCRCARSSRGGLGRSGSSLQPNHRAERSRGGAPPLGGSDSRTSCGGRDDRHPSRRESTPCTPHERVGSAGGPNLVRRQPNGCEILGLYVAGERRGRKAVPGVWEFSS
jgi:hypothetical protein